MKEEVEKLGFGEELERDIVSLCLYDIHFFLDVNNYLKPSHFVSENLARAYAIIQAHFDEYHTIPKEQIVRFLLSKYDIELEEGFFKKDLLNRDFLLNETISLIRYQEMKKFIFRAAAEMDKKTPNYGKFEEELKKILNIETNQNLGTVYFDVDPRFARLKAINDDRLATGIPSVDRALNGGLGRKELTCVAAPPGAGKSYFLTIAGAHILKNRHNVVHYTLEMSEELVALRYDCALLNQTGEEILSDINKAKERIMAHKKIMEENLIIKEFPTKAASIYSIRAHLNKLREQKGFIPNVIIVDYGDIMKPTRVYNSRYEEQGSIFQELRGLGQDLNVPVLTATQTNRGAMSKNIATMEDLGDSFDKARIMDALFMILQKPEEKEDGLLRIYDAKVRNGKAGKMTGYEIDYARAQLREIGEVVNKTDKDK